MKAFAINLFLFQIKNFQAFNAVITVIASQKNFYESHME